MNGEILGVNKRYYPMQGNLCKDFGHDHLEDHEGDEWCNDPPPTLAVLVAGEIGDYACYIGHGRPEWIARHGDKISFREAQCHFPSIVQEKYRS